MDEQVIKTKRGLYGRVIITLPLPVKTSVMDIQKKTGIKKAEFFRVALILGSAQLAEKVIADKQAGLLRSSPPGHAEDGLPAKATESPTLTNGVVE
jgi:hypothetical protein